MWSRSGVLPQACTEQAKDRSWIPRNATVVSRSLAWHVPATAELFLIIIPARAILFNTPRSTSYHHERSSPLLPPCRGRSSLLWVSRSRSCHPQASRSGTFLLAACSCVTADADSCGATVAVFHCSVDRGALLHLHQNESHRLGHCLALCCCGEKRQHPLLPTDACIFARNLLRVASVHSRIASLDVEEQKKICLWDKRLVSLCCRRL